MQHIQIAQRSRIWARFNNLFRLPAAEELDEVLGDTSDNVDNAKDGGKEEYTREKRKAIVKVQSGSAGGTCSKKKNA